MGRPGTATARWSSWSAADHCGSIRAGPCRTSRPSWACNQTGPSATDHHSCAGRLLAWPWAGNGATPASRRLVTRQRSSRRWVSCRTARLPPKASTAPPCPSSIPHGRRSAGASALRCVRESGPSLALQNPDHPLVIASSRFRITLPTIVHAASSDALKCASGLVAPAEINCLAASGSLA